MPKIKKSTTQVFQTEKLRRCLFITAKLIILGNTVLKNPRFHASCIGRRSAVALFRRYRIHTVSDSVSEEKREHESRNAERKNRIAVAATSQQTAQERRKKLARGAMNEFPPTHAPSPNSSGSKSELDISLVPPLFFTITGLWEKFFKICPLISGENLKEKGNLLPPPFNPAGSLSFGTLSD